MGHAPTPPFPLSQVLAGERVSEKADIYSFAVILWELVTGEAPRNRQTRPVRVPDECPAEVAALIDACRARDPAARPSAKEVYDILKATPGPAARRAAAEPAASASAGSAGGLASASAGGGASSSAGAPSAPAAAGRPPLSAFDSG